MKSRNKDIVLNNVKGREKPPGEIFFAFLIAVFGALFAAGILGSTRNVLLGITSFASFVVLACYFNNKRFKTKSIFICFLFILAICLCLGLSDYGINWALLSILTIPICIYVSYCMSSTGFFGNSAEKAFFSIISAALIIWFLLDISSNSLLTIADRDKNFTALLVLLYGMYSYKTKRISGCFVAAVIVLLSQSRACQIGLLLFCVLAFVQEFILKKSRKKAEGGSLKPWTVFLVLCLTGLIIIPVSYFWVDVVSANGYGIYQSSLVDSSNQIRANSNIYALNLMVNDPSFLFFGYGDSTLLQLGISVDPSTYADSAQYGGLRIVQPHNSVLNEVLRNGLLYCLVYLGVLSAVLARHFKYDNAAYIIVYLLISMIMHSLLIQGFLLVWSFVLVSPKRKKWTFLL